jgi:putative Ca2+/H+ antiporter (TMEM165/GDT1 family)
MIDVSAGLTAFGLLFVAEMGDKTQLMAMTLAHRYRPLPVILGVFSAFAVLNVLAVAVGETIFRFVPGRIVLLAAGILFLVFAFGSWRQAGEDGVEGDGVANARNAFLASFGLIFVAELGDKTQLAMVALAAGVGDAVSVFVGGTAALWLVSLIGVAIGSTLLTRLPRRAIHRAAAMLFAVFGLAAVARAVFGGASWATG